jgi:hypothetical protein
MFEFHGWIVINEDDSDDADSLVLNQRRELLCDAIAICIEKLQGPSHTPMANSMCEMTKIQGASRT